MFAIGEWAAFGTALSWGISVHVHGAVAQKVGPEAVTLLRTPYQLVFMAIAYGLFGNPTSFTLTDAMLIFAAAFTGQFLGDLCQYRAMMYIGPTIAILLKSLSACFTAILGALLLDQSLTPRILAGIIIATLGAGMVLVERTGSTLLPGQERPRGRRLVVGTALGLGSALFLACSLILLKFALRNGVTPLWASLTRIMFATVILWSLGLVKGWVRITLDGLRAYPTILWTLLFSNLFSTTGNWLSSVAVHHAPVGIAATIMGLQPVLIMLMGAVWYRKVPSLLVWLGLIVAFVGVVLLFM
ncbi:MAG: hypothetical protein AMR96_05550 [Candidatus Adiutrix intracellularis]|jgi:drug/metabolite transporter (DMT)-like permease|nr:MAG: hypothetical protein AMR96_05550 [Candidatus Adiutrix intracellularis]MDR2827510.1 DMT family transporter [Candidatus Adiutrix intracellularis]